MRDLLVRYRALSSLLTVAMSALESGLGEANIETEPPTTKPVSNLTRVETPTGDLAAILSFQERLAELEDVLKVTVAGSTPGRTTFLVELAPAETQTLHNKVVCSSCGRLITEGVEPPSHGLCEDCAESFLKS